MTRKASGKVVGSKKYESAVTVSADRRLAGIESAVRKQPVTVVPSSQRNAFGEGFEEYTSRLSVK